MDLNDILMNNADILREIQSFTNINSLLNTCTLHLYNKRKCCQLKLTSAATEKYYEDKYFHTKIHSVVADFKRQITLNIFVCN